MSGLFYGKMAKISKKIFITGLILFVSGIPMLEKKYEGRPDWEAYAAKTNAFFPAFPKVKAKIDSFWVAQSGRVGGVFCKVALGGGDHGFYSGQKFAMEFLQNVLIQVQVLRAQRFKQTA